MKIGILTYHRANNYGACLQAIATRLVLEGMGHEVYYVDYWPDYHANTYKVFSFANLKSMNLKIERFFASDVFYNKNISILSNDTDIVEFFDREFDEFVKWFRTDRYLISVNKLVEALNDSIFGTYEKDFYKLNINEYNFENSDYSFKLGVHEDEITSKIQTLCKESELKL